MGRIWDYVYWRLPVGKRQFFDKANNLLEKADSLKQILESGVKNSYNHRNELYNQMSGKIDGLANEVRRLHEENARLEELLHIIINKICRCSGKNIEKMGSLQ